MYLEYQLLNGSDVKAYNDYHEASEEAKKQNLLLAEYGDVYGTINISYAYWNKSGDRNDDEVIIAYYSFDENGNPISISETDLKLRLFY